MNNLEEINYSEVIDSNGVRYQDFRKLLNPQYAIVWRDIIIGYILMLGTLAAFCWIEKMQDYSVLVMMLLCVLFAFVTAFWLSFIQLFIHEAAHYNIHPRKKANDLLANIFIGTILGINIEAYRRTHWKHHQRLGHSDDSEHSYFNALSMINFIKMLTGIHAFSVLLSRSKAESGQNEVSMKQQKISLLIGGFLNAAFLLILSIYGFYFTAAMWVLTVIVFYPFFATIRQILEHRDEKYVGKHLNFFESEHGKVSRMFKPGLLAFFLGGAGFNRHMIHHWDPQVSYTNLKQVEEYLATTAKCGEIIKNSKTTYWRTFLNLLEA